MSAIEIPQRGGFISVLDWVRGGPARRPSRRGEGAATGDAPWSGACADGEASGCIASDPTAIDPRALFARALWENSNLEQDWLWLSTMVTNEGELRYCLERALYINPDSAEARQELARLARRQFNAPTARWAARHPR